MAIPPKRSDRKLVTYLTEHEAAALLAAPDTATSTGRRDHALLTLAIQAGLRVSELTALTRADAFLGTGARRHLHRKGPQTADNPAHPGHRQSTRRLARRAPGKPGDPLFPSRSGSPLSRDAVERRLTKHTAAAARTQPSLKGKKGLASRPEAHRGDAAAGSRSRYHRHRALARARIGRHDPDLHPRRPCHQGKSTPPGQRRSTSGPDATSPRTPSWNSSSPCDYAARRPASRHDRYGTGRRHRHNDQVLIRRIMPTSA